MVAAVVPPWIVESLLGVVVGSALAVLTRPRRRLLSRHVRCVAKHRGDERYDLADQWFAMSAQQRSHRSFGHRVGGVARRSFQDEVEHDERCRRTT
jgi:hypothetical protein